jgi:hypothetical protein
MEKFEQKSIGKEKAIELANSEWWKKEGITHWDICKVQLFTRELCMDFGDFHEAIEMCLGRPVFTHEFGTNIEGIVSEFNKRLPKC